MGEGSERRDGPALLRALDRRFSLPTGAFTYGYKY